MLSALMESSPHNLTAKGSRCCIKNTPYVFTMDVSNSSALFCRQKRGEGKGGIVPDVVVERVHGVFHSFVLVVSDFYAIYETVIRLLCFR